jgi:hypothetical protein
VTTFLAIWGAVLATVLGVFEGFRFFLDRPRLKVAPRLTINVNGAWLMVQVVNRGRRPTTVTEAGFEPLADLTMTFSGGETVGGRRWLRLRTDQSCAPIAATVSKRASASRAELRVAGVF